jgi:hypothetical protein
MPVTISCPRCKGVSTVEDREVGLTVRCPRCANLFPAAQSASALAPPTPEPVEGSGGEEKLRPLSLERVPFARVDRLLPARSAPFLVAVAGIAVGCWGIGFLLAGDKAGFLASREWQVQPLFLATHLVCLRLFVTCYTRNYLAGAARMDLAPGEATRMVQLILGPYGGLIALLVALPLCVSNLLYLQGPDYLQDAVKYGGGDLALIDLFLWLIWCAEWILNAYIWVVLVSFLALTMWTLHRHHFRSTIEVLLHEKQYRPFLMMSAQGASVLLLFTAVNGFYVWYAEGVLTDYIGLGITGTLLLLGFGPPWMQLKGNVERAVNDEMARLQEQLVRSMSRRTEAVEDGKAVTTADLAERLDTALSVLRSMYLDRMHRELGKAEGKALLLKLLAPAGSVAWKVLRPLVMP